MFTERSGKQNRLEMVVLEELVPQDHLLRKIDATIDFSFINKICKPYYCENNGRPAIEPEVLFRMLFIGYLYGIRSEIRLLKEIEPQDRFSRYHGADEALFDLLHRAGGSGQHDYPARNYKRIPWYTGYSFAKSVACL